jgi:putative FmdB family regulatory protein
VPVYEYRCVHPGCGFVQEEYRRTADDRERCAECPRCGGPAGVIWSSPAAVWHPTASDRFGETWGNDLRHDGAERTGDYIRRKRAERAREERERA